MRVMKIAFFGDSFCSHLDGKQASVGSYIYNNINYRYDTYIKKLELHYSAEIVHLGLGGSSIYDVILSQFPNFLKENSYPDVCVFVWTDRSRIFHKTVRNITPSTTFDTKHHKDKDLEVWNSAKAYYTHLYDHDSANFQFNASLSYFDHTVLSEFSKSTKIIHMWSFSNQIHHNTPRWNTGVEIVPALIEVSKLKCDLEHHPGYVGADTSLNHLAGPKKNELVFNWIRNAIDNYKNGELIDESSTIQPEHQDWGGDLLPYRCYNTTADQKDIGKYSYGQLHRLSKS